MIIKNIDPTANDDARVGYRIGMSWLNQSSGKIFTCVNETNYGAVWTSETSSVDASEVGYDNTTSGLGADDVQEAIDELYAAIPLPIVESSYADLVTLMNTGQLLPGLIYVISDYITRYQQPVSGEILYEDLEYIAIKAISYNKFELSATSLTNPLDIIHYDINNNVCEDGITERPGKITYRKDTVNQLEAHYDFRNVKFRRWETIENSGVFDSFTDTGFAYQDFLTFGTNCDSIVIESNFDYNNITFGEQCADIKIYSNSSNMQFPNFVYGFYISDNVTNFIAPVDSRNIKISSGLDLSTLDFNASLSMFDNMETILTKNVSGYIVEKFIDSYGNEIVYSYDTGTAVRVTPLRYKALLSQSGTNAPTVVVLENTLGVSLTLSYDGVGSYFMTPSSDIFIQDKTYISPNSTTDFGAALIPIEEGISYINLYTRNNIGTLTNNALSYNESSILIEVYP